MIDDIAGIPATIRDFLEELVDILQEHDAPGIFDGVIEPSHQLIEGLIHLPFDGLKLFVECLDALG